MNGLFDLYANAQDAFFQHAVLPLLYGLGLGGFAEDAYRASEWFLVGLLEIAVLVLIIGPLQRCFPVERVDDRRAVRIDILYTLIHRLGLFRLALFFLLDPLVLALDSELRFLGWSQLNVEAWWPGVTSMPLVSFFVYLLLFDLFDYGYHRLSHRFQWWWQLHALHHSQRQMTMWSDNRNHLLDDLLRDAAVALLALAIGVEPSQFVLLIACSQLLQSLQHANLRLGFGWLGERLIVSPRFHRLHHAIGVGHERPGRPDVLGGCNFGAVFPYWDMLFGTADFSPVYHPTGIRDQLPQPVGRGRDYGRGFWQQQWYGVRRLFGRA